ncbi:uncharacterized protein DNG_07942 [Cephalotrichum gorgonifer]|uniref:Uncharacterized protein n=1 Tax=Cephalotrichum gorgonifer TaxID=2041049 RepID=A0AAE8N2T6_9PEZI|nr:uncharacterized protein DNG_07942 [Cephalotrichum gorgonifer]
MSASSEDHKPHWADRSFYREPGEGSGTGTSMALRDITVRQSEGIIT